VYREYILKESVEYILEFRECGKVSQMGIGRPNGKVSQMGMM